MRKTVKVESERIVHVCDLCGRQSDSVDNCWFCRRECCFKCRTLMFCASSGDWIDFATKVCQECQRHTELVEKVQSILDGANATLREWLDVWKKAVAT